MICTRCCQNREEGDFFIESALCYKCIYQEKTTNVKSRNRNNLCRICNQECEEHRWVYCSSECATIGELKQKKSYWTTKVRSL